MKLNTLVIAWTLALGHFTVVPSASGEPPAVDNLLAEGLFEEAKELMSKGAYANACNKLERSQKLDPAGGTLIALALCYENTGRIASALLTFKDALAQATSDQRPDRMKLARTHIESLQPNVPRITIGLGETQRQGSEVQLLLDDHVIEASSLGSTLPIDPGFHCLAILQDGVRTWERRFSIKQGEHFQLMIATLPVTEPRAPKVTAPERPPLTRTSYADPEREASRSARRVWGVTATGIGSAMLLGGVYFGARTLANERLLDRVCTEAPCDAQYAELQADTHRSAQYSTALLFVGVVAIVTGAYMLIFEPPTPKVHGKKTKVRRVGNLGGGAALTW